MNQIQKWVWRYWWVLVLVIVIGFVIGSREYTQRVNYGFGTGGVVPMMQVERGALIDDQISMGMPSPIYQPGISTSTDRLVIQENMMSLLVEDVNGTADRIQKLAEESGGFLVSKNIERPEENATGTISVRVPAAKRDEMLDKIAALSVRVVSENVWGDDVTAQFEDLNAKLTTLEKTKGKLEALLDQTASVEDILRVQQELNNLQYQIDAVRGQKDYLEKAAAFSQITAYLSTDELALPYAPDEGFRPQVILKQAIRELVRTGRQILAGLIWVAVFSPVWITLLIIWYLIMRLYGKKKD